MSRTDRGEARFAPMLVLSFSLVAPRGGGEKKSFGTRYVEYGDLDNVPDRIRFCRLRMGLKQEEAAALIGLTKDEYSVLELGQKQYCPKTTADKLAELFRVPSTDLLNDYSLFIYNGQGRAIKALRDRLGLSKTAMARYLHTDHGTLKDWEEERRIISYRAWERCFKGQ